MIPNRHRYMNARTAADRAKIDAANKYAARVAAQAAVNSKPKITTTQSAGSSGLALYDALYGRRGAL